MAKFLRESWIWILLPILVMSGIVTYILYAGPEESVCGFSYPIQ